MILQITELSKSFYQSSVFNKFSLRVESGERVGLTGPNGSGKTTLLKMISGIMSFDSGEIDVGEQKVHSENLDSRKNLYYIGHSIGLYPGLTGRENLDFIAKLYEKSSSKNSDILTKVGLISSKMKNVKFYSHGMRQRLKLASALLIDPDLLLLDEPVTGLDSDGIKLFENIMLDWTHQEKTIMIVSHDLDWLSSQTDRIVELD